MLLVNFKSLKKKKRAFRANKGQIELPAMDDRTEKKRREQTSLYKPQEASSSVRSMESK